MLRQSAVDASKQVQASPTATTEVEPDPAKSGGLSAQERAIRARIAAHSSWAKTVDRTARTAPARRSLYERFLEEADGDPIRADHAWKAHFAKLALRSATARRKARELLAQADAADAELADAEVNVEDLSEQESA